MGMILERKRRRRADLSAEEDLSIQRLLREMLGVCCLCAASFALLLLLLLPIFALVLGQLQQTFGDLVVAFTALEVGVAGGKWIEAFYFGL